MITLPLWQLIALMVLIAVSSMAVLIGSALIADTLETRRWERKVEAEAAKATKVGAMYGGVGIRAFSKEEPGEAW